MAISDTEIGEREWSSLRHNGVNFPDPYERLPDTVRFYYDGEVMKLSKPAEEVAGFYAKMLYHVNITKPQVIVMAHTPNSHF